MNLRLLAICGFIAVCLAQVALAGGKSSRSYESASRSDKSRSKDSKEISVSVSISKEIRGSDSRSSEGKKTFFWGYKPWNGPYVWPKYFPAGKGKEQSPINIETKSKEVGFDRLLTPLKFNYDAENNIVIKNNGRGFIVEFDDETESGISGGPLTGEYKLKRMIVHWGKKDSWGSEHLIDGQAFAGEVQLVHYNKAKYGTFDEASTHGDGLAMLTVFLKLSEDKNRAITLITKYLRKIRKPFMEVKLVKNEKLFLTDLLPEDVTRFWTYAGSLTQPPLTENSIWIILRDPIAVHKHQLKIWRKLYPHNRRPVQPLRDRVIRSSFHEMKEKKAEKEAGSQQEQQQEKPKQKQ